MVVLEHVVKQYGDGAKVVDDVSFTVADGETMVLLGTSGSGKTTTLKVINQLIRQTSGRVLIDGQDVSTMGPVVLRRGIGYVIQQIGLMPHLNIMDNITFVLQITGYPKSKLRSRAEELLQIMGLPESYLKRHPAELSGGEQQRVGVARALAADPAIILMDEPFGALDPITRDQLQKQLVAIQQSFHKTIIFVTHDVHEAFRLGTKIGVMQKGRLIRLARPVDLVLNQDDPFVREFIGTSGLFDLLDIFKVEDAMVPAPLVKTGETLGTAALRLGERDFVLVVDDRGAPVGEISRTGVLAGPPGAVVAEDLARPVRERVSPGQSLKQAMEQMVLGERSWLPVVGTDNQVLGLVTLASCSRNIRAKVGE